MAKRRRLNREIVVQKAAEMADKAGRVEAVTLTDLAAALQVRVPSLYNHVDNLDDLRRALAVYAVEQLLATLRAATAGKIGRDAVQAMAHAYRRFGQVHPGIYFLTIRAPDPNEEALVALSQELLQMVLMTLASLGLQGDDALHAVRGLRAILHGYTALEAAQGFKMDLDREESFRRLVDAFLAGATPS